MTLKEKIAQDFITALKAKNPAKTTLGFIKATIETEEKNTKLEANDEAVLKILNKMLKNLEGVLANEITIQAPTDTTRAEIALIESYMPQKMSDDEIRTEIESAIKNGASNIGGIMAWFNGKAVDKKVVSTMANAILSNK